MKKSRRREEIRTAALLAAVGGTLILGSAAGLWLLWGGGSTSDVTWLPPSTAAPKAAEPVPAAPAPLSFAELAGCSFAPRPARPSAAPRPRFIPLPDFPGAYAVWGATGRDRRGHIWVGISARDVSIPSAHLIEYDPDADVVHDRGDVVSALESCGVYRRGEGQMKIHSRIIQAADGHLYFASMDEQGEAEDGSCLPTWGGHLWRLRLPENRWEHLERVPEGLIAVAGVGRYVYALGYFGHVLYQYDTATNTTSKVRVGSVGGHISRNFLADARGHVYVPRLRERPGADEPLVTLVEFDASLKQVAENPLRNYMAGRDPTASHGIVGLQYLADGSMVFVTHRGFFYRITPQEEDLPARLSTLGWFHPNGEAYCPSLFTFDGADQVLGVAHVNGYQWVTYDLANRTARATALPMPNLDGQPVADLALYGSVARDNQGNFYIAGTGQQGGRVLPFLVQLRPAP
jgi:hypothetical protein